MMIKRLATPRNLAELRRAIHLLLTDAFSDVAHVNDNNDCLTIGFPDVGHGLDDVDLVLMSCTEMADFDEWRKSRKQDAE